MLGGPGAGLTDPVVTDPVKMTLRATVNARRTLRAGFTTVRNLGLFVKTGGYLLDVALERGDRRRLGRGPPHRPGRPRHLPDRRPPRPERAERPGAAHDAAVGRGGHRRRRRRGPQGGPLPDQARRQAHQVLRLRRRDAPTGPAGRPAVLDRGAGRDRRRGPPARACGSPPTATATRPSTPRSTPASTASSTGS